MKPEQGKAAFRSAIAGMMTMVGPSNRPETAQDAAAPQQEPGQAAEDLGEAKQDPGEAPEVREAPVPDREEAEEQ